MQSAWLFAGILAWTMALAAQAADHREVPLADNLKADAAEAWRRKVPIMLLFATHDCHYCQRVRNEYLGPMVDDPVYRAKVMIKQIAVGSGRGLIGFDGKKTTHGAYAASQKIFLVPTIAVVDAQGNALSPPIVGLLTPDFYFGYIEAAIEEGLEKVRGDVKPH